jgi:hypothetical protein
MNHFLRLRAVAALLCSLVFFPASVNAGMTQREIEEFKSWKAKADRGDPNAQFNVGVCYSQELGVYRDLAEGAAWYLKAALQGYRYAQNNLGNCYASGEGVPKDEIEAYAYFNLVGVSDEYAREKVARLEKGMTPEAKLKGQQRTKELQKEIEANKSRK